MRITVYIPYTLQQILAISLAKTAFKRVCKKPTQVPFYIFNNYIAFFKMVLHGFMKWECEGVYYVYIFC